MDVRAPDTDGESRRGLRFGLGAKIFLLTSLVVLLAVGSAVVFTSLRSDAIARETVADSLAASYSMESTFTQQRYDLLQLISNLFVADPYLTAYMAEAAAAGDTRSMVDLLIERRSDLGYDFAILLDPEGRVLARTDRPDAAGEDLSQRPLVATALEDYEASGVWREPGGLYEAVAVPVLQRVDLLGFLVTGFALTDAEARRVQQLGGTEMVFLTAGEEGFRVVASTVEPLLENALLDELAARPALVDSVMGEGRMVETFDLVLSAEPWIGRLAPLKDAAGRPVGASVALASMARQLAPYRQINTVLLLAGLVSLLAASALAWALARRTLRPVDRLVAAADAARRGDYDQRIPEDRNDEIGDLAASFNALLTDLREKRDLAAYMTELSRNLPDAGSSSRATPTGEATAARAPEPETVAATLLGVELRHHARAARGEAPGRVAERLEEEVSSLGRLAASHGGRLEAAAGHRVWLGFPGARSTIQALAAAIEKLLETDPEAVGGEDEEIALALVRGRIVAGPGRRGSGGRTLLGLPVQQLELLLREATPGEILMSREVHHTLAPLLETAGLELPQRRGVANAVPFHVVTPELGRKMTGGQSVAGPSHPPTGEIPAATSEATRRLSSGASGVRGLAALSGLRAGAVVGDRFEILDTLGSGGMGVVYKARDRELSEVVALKMLRPDKGLDAEGIERLKQEIKLARRITHPNVLRTYDLGTVDGVPFLSMEYVPGLTLRALLDRLTPSERLPYSAGLRLARQLAEGLGAVHEVGVIHRDFKPENVLLEPGGNAKIMDFGIARQRHDLGSFQTAEGFLVGTPGYLAPEQIRGGDVDARTDLFAYGAVLYELFTGRRPFRAATPMDTVMETLNDDPPLPSDLWPEIDERLEEILLVCLRKDPDERFADAATVLRRLRPLRS